MCWRGCEQTLTRGKRGRPLMLSQARKLKAGPKKPRSIGLNGAEATEVCSCASFDAENWTHFPARGARGLRTETIAYIDERSQSPKPFTAPDTQTPITSFTGGRDLVCGEQAVGPIGRHLVSARMGHPHQCRSRSFHASLPAVQGEPTSRG